ncbi:MAG: hypothetical protein KDC47_02345 [Flavobacteriaceae bacterium]|nr:hypothetical protein [Flavobacteriaceae bacterium]
MPYMMNKKFWINAIIVVNITIGFAQTESLSNSPYSLYGLGTYNDISTGKTNGLGRTGLAMPSDVSINSFNPASLGIFSTTSFLYDIGFNAKLENLNQNGIKEYKKTGNFSDISFAFPINEKSAMSVALVPLTNVGYYISGIKTDVEGYEGYYLSDFEGSGGLNDLKINYGRSYNKLRIGISGSLLFGKISQTETNYIGTTSLMIDEKNNYTGFRITGGTQYDVSPKITLGAIVSLPTTLNAKQQYTITQDGEELLSSSERIEDFKLPMEVGLGTHVKFNDRAFMNIDYKRRLWDSTNQSDGIGDFVDQQLVGLGIEYMPVPTTFTYFSRIQYRIGFNYDSGYLSIKNNRIDNYAINVGVGLPTNSKNNSLINLAYAYGKNGRIDNGLIKENYHMLTLNVSLEGIWFQKKIIY